MTPRTGMQVLKGGALYFVLVFAAGFALGTARILWLAPLLGERTAELAEAPVMLAISALAARWLTRRPGEPLSRAGWLGAGFVALALLLAAELTVVLWLRGLTLRAYVAGRDPVAGSVYLLSLALFALMPLLVAPRGGRQYRVPQVR